MNVIQAQVIQHAQSSLEICFTVKIVAPIEMPPRIYKISHLDVMMRSVSTMTKRVIFDLLYDRVLCDYNSLIEDSPILDMFEDPIKYKQATSVDFKLIYPDEIRSL